MSRSPTKQIAYDGQWECHLTATPARVRRNEPVTLTVVLSHPLVGDLKPDEHRTFYDRCLRFIYSSDDPRLTRQIDAQPAATRNPAVIRRMPPLPAGDYTIRVTVVAGDDLPQILSELPEPFSSLDFPRLPETLKTSTAIEVVEHHVEATVSLKRSASLPTDDEALWAAIRNRTAAVGFARYQKFIDRVLGQVVAPNPGASNIPVLGGLAGVDRSNHLGSYTYGLVKYATEAFLTLEAGVVIREQSLVDLEKEDVRFSDPNVNAEVLSNTLKNYLVRPNSTVLPYLDRIVSAFISLDTDDDPSVRRELPLLEQTLRHRLTSPSMIELIWSYWQEQGMVMQTVNAIARRFQNRRGSDNDPLGELEFDSLRPLNGVLWGFIQDEQNRLTVPRRAHEYLHHYGLALEGRAVADMYPADSRSQFIEAFHNLLYRAELFFRQDRDATMIADGFPLLNALKEVHLLLAEGAHNQFGDLTWTARNETLVAQWMLARPEMREFLRGRYMVPYQEPWMGAVDAMKRLQGWGDTSIMHFHELAVTGERILLSIRYGDWANLNNIEQQASNWARTCMPELRRYMDAYRTVTGVDLTSDTTDTRDGAIRFTQPSALLQKRLANQRVQGSLAPPSEAGLRALRAPGQPAASTIKQPTRSMVRLPRSGAGPE